MIKSDNSFKQIPSKKPKRVTSHEVVAYPPQPLPDASHTDACPLTTRRTFAEVPANGDLFSCSFP